MAKSIIIQPTTIADFIVESKMSEFDEVAVHLEPIQSGSGTPSPSNPREISGFTGASVYHSGKNLFKTNITETTVSGVTFTPNSDGSITASGTATGSISTFEFGRIYLPKGRYYFSGLDTGRADNIGRLCIAGVTGTLLSTGIVYDGTSKEIRVTKEGIFKVYPIIAQTFNPSLPKTYYPMITLKSDTVYEQYVGDTYEWTFPTGAGTVYGGILDIANRKLTVTHAIVRADSYTWEKNSTQNNPNGTLFSANYVSTDFAGWTDAIDSALSNVLIPDRGTLATAAANSFWWDRAATGLRVCWGTASGGSSLSDFQTFITNSNVVFYGLLKTPIVYDISTEQSISPIIGRNIVWSDSGDVSIEYNIEPKIKLNGDDVTNYFTSRGMKVSYIKVHGNNGGTFLTGEREEDILAWKSVVTLTCMPLTESQQSEILQKIISDNPTLYYFDPRINSYRTINYIASVEEVQHRGKGGTGIDYWTGLVLTAEEK